MADESESRAAESGRGTGRPTPKGGRDAVLVRVLDAAELLFSEHPYADVSVRAVADAAGVSHALVHRYVGTKADILRAVLARREGALAAAAQDATTVRDAAALMLGGDMESARRYFRIVLRICMDSVLRRVTGPDFVATQLLTRTAVADVAAAGVEPEVDPWVAVAAGVSMVIGFAGLQEVLLHEVGLDGADGHLVDEQLARLADLVLRAGVSPSAGA